MSKKIEVGDWILAIVDITKGGAHNKDMSYPIAQCDQLRSSSSFDVKGGGFYFNSEVVKLPSLGKVLWAKEISDA